MLWKESNLIGKMIYDFKCGKFICMGLKMRYKKKYDNDTYLYMRLRIEWWYILNQIDLYCDWNAKSFWVYY